MNDLRKRYWVWMDGKILAPGEARVDAFDHGFLYGDSIYETLRSHEGRPFAMHAHLDRLEASARGVEMRLPLNRQEFEQAIRETIDARPRGQEAGVRLMVTRGIGPLGIDIEDCNSPDAILFGWGIAPGPHPMAETGIPVVVSSVRRNPTSALDPQIKSGNFLNNIMAFRQARAAGAYEAILLTVDGTIAEATTSNLFWIKGDEVRSCVDEGILLGVTRKTVLALLAANKIQVALGRFPVEELHDADECFITSTLKGVLPVTKVDGTVIGNGVGPLTRRLQTWYENAIRAEAMP